MVFKITLPEQQVKPEVLFQRMKAMFFEDLEKEGLLAKVFIFVYMYQPIKVTDLTKKLNDYYKTDFDRSAVGRALSKLVEKHVLCTKSSGEALSEIPSDQTDMDKRIIEKYHSFLSQIPEPFRNRYLNVNYFWVSNGEGIKYIEWCCKILKFSCEDQK